MIPGVTERVPVADRLIARWEVSQLNVVPYAISVMAFLGSVHRTDPDIR